MHVVRSFIAAAVCAAIFAVALTASTIHAADSCGGGCPTLPKDSRSVSAVVPALPAFGAPLLVATLAKGKAKRILQVEAMLTTLIGTSVKLGMFARVNGINMEPFGLAAAIDCSTAAENCTLTGTFWLDMDANPSLIGVPITVTLLGGNTNGAAPAATATMTVRQEKK